MTGAFPALHPGIWIDTCDFADADIIIDRCAGKQIAQRGEQLRPVTTQPLHQLAALATELPLLFTVLDRYMLRLLAELGALAGSWCERQGQRGGKAPAIPGDTLPRWRPGSGKRLDHFNTQPQLAFQGGQFAGNQFDTAFRSQSQVKLTLCYRPALMFNAPAQLFIVAVAEEIFAGDAHG